MILFRRWGSRRPLDIISLWGKGFAWILGIKVKRHNERNWPGGDIIIANHMGFLDIPVLLSYFPAVFMIKMEVRHIFYFGSALKKHGHVFVERSNNDSCLSAIAEVRRVLEEGDRIIIFSEGRASPDAKRQEFKPYCFYEAARLGKRIEACVIDYLPDRRLLKWDINRPLLPQLLKLFSQRRIEISIEFFPSEIPTDPKLAAKQYHDVIESRLMAHDRERIISSGAQGI